MVSQEDTTQKNESKLAILGLESAGKTSIVKVLTQEFDMLTVLKPTQSVERTTIEILGNDIVLWDFGGQKRYRKKYLSTPHLYFDKIALVYYVIDVQDRVMLEDSIEYFLIILENLKVYSPKAKIIILFHKSDPDVDKMKEITQLKQRFLDAIREALEISKMPIIMYTTSIYNHMSIITAFSQPILGSDEIYKKISIMLHTFTDTYNLGFTVLFTKNYFELGNWLSERIMVTTRDTLLRTMMKSFTLNMTEKTMFTEVLAEYHTDLKLMIGSFGLHVGEGLMPFYLVIGYDEETVLERNELKIALEKMIDNLEKVLENIDLVTIETNNIM